MRLRVYLLAIIAWSVGAYAALLAAAVLLAH